MKCVAEDLRTMGIKGWNIVAENRRKLQYVDLLRRPNLTEGCRARGRRRMYVEADCKIQIFFQKQKAFKCGKSIPE